MNPWKVTIRKHRATWHWFTTNPQGGGFGSSYCGPKHIALARATANIPEGETYWLDGCQFVKRTIKACAPSVREDRRTGQFVPTIDGKDESPTSYDRGRALDIAKQTAAKLKTCAVLRCQDTEFLHKAD